MDWPQVISTNFAFTKFVPCMVTSPRKRKDKTDTLVNIEHNAVDDKSEDAVFLVVKHASNNLHESDTISSK